MNDNKKKSKLTKNIIVAGGSGVCSRLNEPFKGVLCCGLSLSIATFALMPSDVEAIILIDVPNGDFEAAGNEGDSSGFLLGTLGGYDDEVGDDGPWRATGQGVEIGLGLGSLELLAPVATIDNGVAAMGGLTVDSGLLATLDGFGLLDAQPSSGSFYQDSLNGVKFIEGNEYTLSVEIETTGILELSVLYASGTGIAFRSGGDTLALEGDGNLLSLTVLDPIHEVVSEHEGVISYTFVAGSELDGLDIGIELYVGKGGGLADLNALGGVIFDNVTLTTVPEPSAAALLLGVAALAVVGRRRV